MENLHVARVKITVSITETTEHGKEEEDDTTETLTHVQSMLGASSLQQSEENMVQQK